MKYSIKISRTDGNTTIDFIAQDIPGSDFIFVRDDLLQQLNTVMPKTQYNAPKTVEKTDYKPATNFNSNPISEKQVKHLRGLGYEGNLEGLTITDGDALIKEIYKEKGITGKWHK